MTKNPLQQPSDKPRGFAALLAVMAQMEREGKCSCGDAVGHMGWLLCATKEATS